MDSKVAEEYSIFFAFDRHRLVKVNAAVPKPVGHHHQEQNEQPTLDGKSHCCIL